MILTQNPGATLDDLGLMIGKFLSSQFYDWDAISIMTNCRTWVRIINQTIVTYGQELHGQASQSVRADSFVIETNIHHPTESSLIYDGVRKIVPLCVILATELDQPSWRQADHLVKQIKNDGLDRVDGTSPCSELS